ncbi:MAG: BrxE family protein [Gammaproteobacteria bacterium]
MNDDAHSVAELRVLVGYLGEQAQMWWPSRFFGPEAAAFLAPVFARSRFLAQCQGVSAAAARLHDEFIGVGRAFHLFRLPEVFEQAVASVLMDPQFEAQVREHLASREQALARLEAIGTAVRVDEGPVVVGDWNDSLDEALKTIAGLYYDAFTKGVKTFPYLREL